MPKFCGNCGSPLNATAIFCGGCGSRIPRDPAPAAFTPTPVTTPDTAGYAPVPAAFTPTPVTTPDPAGYAPVPAAFTPTPVITPDPSGYAPVPAAFTPTPVTTSDPSGYAPVPAAFTPAPVTTPDPAGYAPVPAAFTPAPVPTPNPADYAAVPAAFTPTPVTTPAPVATPGPAGYAPVSAAPAPALGNAYPAAPVKKSNTLLKVVIAVILVLFMGATLVLAGLWYAAQKIKAKAHAVAAQVLSGAAAVPATRPSGAGSPYQGRATSSANAPLSPPAASSFPTWTPTASSGPLSGGPAPLRVGMLVVTAIADARGDYESLKQIQSIDGSGTTLSYHSEGPRPATGTQGASAATQAVSISRKVLPQDLRSAHEYAEVFGSTDPQSYPGTTAISASQDVLSELKQKGTTEFSFRPDGLKGAIGSLVSKFSALAGAAGAKDVGGVSLDKFSKEQCSLQREGNGLFAFPVLLNAQPVTLPALRAGCMTDDGPADFYILDQPDYPLMLSWKLGSGSQLQVIKIAYPPPPATRKSEAKAAPSAIEQQLKEKKKVDIYGIYFDFASDRLKPESTPVLEEIAGVLKDNPDWKLTVNGHTDNVGGDVYNLDLSKRRSAAVKQALVTEYHVAPERLATDGFGASRPVDTNDTLAGRARNRRVELTRE